MEAKVFTPRDARTGARLTFNQSDVKVVAGDPYRRGLGFRAVVEVAGERYTVTGAECGLPNCHCAAKIQKQEEF